MLTETYKGWISPTGEAHIFPESEEHGRSIPPSAKPLKSTDISGRVKELQKQGYARFGVFKDHKDDDPYGYIHYDGKSKHAKKAALHALRHMALPGSSKVILDPQVGFQQGETENEFGSPEIARRHMVTEDHDYCPGLKGWMSPSGKSHLFHSGYYHEDNLHPEGSRDQYTDLDSGFVKFHTGGDDADPYLTYHHSPIGAKTALHTLDFIQHKDGSPLHISRNNYGDYKSGAFFNARHSREFIKTGHKPKLNESDDFNYGVKGWMSPSGKPHLFAGGDFHDDNPHPDAPKNSDDHLKHGFVKFYQDSDNDGAGQSYIDFHASSPGIKTALKTLDYLKVPPGKNVSLIRRNPHPELPGNTRSIFSKNPKHSREFIKTGNKPIISEDAPVNNVGSGHIAGAGVGPQGEPGVDPDKYQLNRRKKKKLGEPPMYQVSTLVPEGNFNKLSILPETFSRLRVYSCIKSGILKESNISSKIKVVLEDTDSPLVLENSETKETMLIQEVICPAH